MILGQPVTIKPTYRVLILKDDGTPLDFDGETVIATSYWLRRLNNGDIQEIKPLQPQSFE
jgi:hypothetical protein